MTAPPEKTSLTMKGPSYLYENFPRESGVTCEDLLIFLQEVDHPGSLRGVEGYPNLQGVGLFFGAHVDLLRWLDRGDLMVFEATQTLFYLGHLTILGKPFPKVYGLGLIELLSGWVRTEASRIWIRVEPGNSRESS
ncbi:hypothetical protein CRG98_001209 [Punica granatum]|uniref:Uncharacterized protein n=1 Tax=Punica granatum TaxID=22663 RepID=A0A2I0LCI3_PUNGR|nr:hypothetical protein CRG98_001209 [Punica granatum]